MPKHFLSSFLEKMYRRHFRWTTKLGLLIENICRITNFNGKIALTHFFSTRNIKIRSGRYWRIETGDPPLVGGNLKRDLVSRSQGDIALDVILAIRQEEAFATVFVANATLRVRRLGQLGGDYAEHTLFTQYHLRCNLSDSAGYRFASAPVVSHFKLNRVTYFEVLDVAVELAEVEEEPSLPVTALDEAVRVLLNEVHIRKFYRKISYSACIKSINL